MLAPSLQIGAVGTEPATVVTDGAHGDVDMRVILVVVARHQVVVAIAQDVCRPGGCGALDGIRVRFWRHG